MADSPGRFYLWLRDDGRYDGGYLRHDRTAPEHPPIKWFGTLLDVGVEIRERNTGKGKPAPTDTLSIFEEE